MDEQLKAMFPWLGAQNIQYTPYKGLFVGAKEGEESPRLGFGFNVNNQEYVYVPQSILNKGVVTGNQQHYFPAVITPGFNEKLQQEGKFYTPEQITQLTGNNEFERDYKNSPYKNETGVLVPVSLLAQFPQNKEGKILRTYTMGPVEGGFIYGPIEGIYTNPNGQVTYKIQGGGKENPRAWINPDTLDPQGLYYNPGKKWYETTLGKVGIALIAGGTAGLALGGAGAAGGAAGSGAAGGTAAGGAGIVGTPGVSTIFPVAAPVAPTVTSIAPMAAAGGAAAAGAASNASLYPAVEVAPSFTPAPGSLQATLPSLGVETAASAAPFTAIPGSFQAALPVLGIASAPSLAGNLAAASSGISATDALRIANQARGLLGAGQNPIVPQQQGLPQQAGGAQGVDYSGLLSLLQLQAGLPGVAPLTAPAQLRQIYQPTLLPNVLSLLG